MHVPSDPNYAQRFAALADVVLEESWVLSYRVDGPTVTFDLEAVLTTDHPQYQPAQPNDSYATVHLPLTITGRALTFQPSYAPPAIDATGVPDHGHIDTFNLVSTADTTWELTGDWGRITVTDPEVTNAW
jgi:hypothetical protein